MQADPIWIGPALAVHADKLPEHAEMEAGARAEYQSGSAALSVASLTGNPGPVYHYDGLNPWISAGHDGGGRLSRLCLTLVCIMVGLIR